MDGHVEAQNEEANSAKKQPASNRSRAIDVLLIGRDPVIRLYKDEVLRQAGFEVHAVTPWEAKGLIQADVHPYSVVVLSNTLYPEDVAEIGLQVRRYSPKSKLLLMLGPDPISVDLSMFDTVLEVLEGPAALVRTVRRLTTPTALDGAGNGSVAASA